MTLTFRPARPRDLDAILEVYTVAYPDDRPAEVRRRQLTSHPFGALGRLLLAEEDGTLVGFGFGFDVRVGYGGRLVKAAAVASVAVAAHARGRGVGSAVVRRIEDRAREEGAAVSLLYPFRQAFYGRLGYAAVSARKRLELAPESIPRSFADVPSIVVGPLAPADSAQLRAVYTRCLRRQSGLVDRGDAAWEIRLHRERTHYLVARTKRGARVVGYVAFSMVQAEAHGATTLVVQELVSDDLVGRRALLGALSRMRDQVRSVVLELAVDDPLEQALLDADGREHGTADVEHPLGLLVAGPMVALLDVPRAIAARGYVSDGTFGLLVEDDPATPLVVTVKGGRATVREGTTRNALRTTRRGLAQILYGALEVESAVALGLADAREDLARRVARIVRIPGVLSFDPF